MKIATSTPNQTNKDPIENLATNVQVPEANNSVKEFKVTQETNKLIKKLELEGTTNLKAYECVTTYEVKRELHPETHQPYKIVDKKLVKETCTLINFNLIEVTKEEVEQCRKAGIPSFLLKLGEKLYYAHISPNITFTDSNLLGGKHKCALQGKECKRLSAASDENGGCEKVRNYCNRIERYQFIARGYETFNTHNDSFFVASCDNYEECPPRPEISKEEKYRMKLALAQYVWDDIKTLLQSNQRVESNIATKKIPY